MTRLTDSTGAPGPASPPPSFLPSLSKEVWFQRQTFPRNVLAVLWDFKGLRWIQMRLWFLQTFSSVTGLEPARAGSVEQHGDHSTNIIFPKKKPPSSPPQEVGRGMSHYLERRAAPARLGGLTATRAWLRSTGFHLQKIAQIEDLHCWHISRT